MRTSSSALKTSQQNARKENSANTTSINQSSAQSFSFLVSICLDAMRYSAAIAPRANEAEAIRELSWPLSKAKATALTVAKHTPKRQAAAARIMAARKRLAED